MKVVEVNRHAHRRTLYRGTFLLSLLRTLAIQEKVGLFIDVLPRVHLFNALATENFWQECLRPYLFEECRAVLRVVAAHRQ